MKISVVKMVDPNELEFVLRDSTPAKANALRRTMLSDIPKMAIDDVEFHLGPIDVDGKEFESITPLFDEIIAHRLGMVPVPTDYERFNTKDKCACGGVGCPSCEIMYSLNKHGPCTVLSGDLQPLGDSTLRVKDEEIPIVELADGQSVLIYAHAVMGTAKKHVKWQAANGVGYKYLPRIKILKPDVGPETAQEIIVSCPKKVFVMKNGKLSMTKSASHDCSLCGSCIEGAGKDVVDVQGDDSNIFFRFETDGSLTAKQVLEKAAEILSEEAKSIAEAISEL